METVAELHLAPCKTPLGICLAELLSVTLGRYSLGRRPGMLYWLSLLRTWTPIKNPRLIHSLLYNIRT